MFATKLSMEKKMINIWLLDFLFLPAINTFDSKAIPKKEGPKKFEEPDKKK